MLQNYYNNLNNGIDTGRIEAMASAWVTNIMGLVDGCVGDQHHGLSGRLRG
jgi:hypothetical protein